MDPCGPLRLLTKVLEALLEKLAEGGPDGFPLDDADFDEFMAALESEESDADIAAIADEHPELALADEPLEPAVADEPPPLPPPPPLAVHALPWYTCYLANGGKLSWYLRQYKWEARCRNPVYGQCDVLRPCGLKKSNMW